MTRGLTSGKIEHETPFTLLDSPSWLAVGSTLLAGDPTAGCSLVASVCSIAAPVSCRQSPARASKEPSSAPGPSPLTTARYSGVCRGTTGYG